MKNFRSLLFYGVMAALVLSLRFGVLDTYAGSFPTDVELQSKMLTSQPPLMLAALTEANLETEVIQSRKAVQKASKRVLRAQQKVDEINGTLATLAQKLTNDEISQSQFDKDQKKLLDDLEKAKLRLEVREQKAQVAEARALEKLSKKELNQAKKDFKNRKISEAQLREKEQALQEAQNLLKEQKQDLKDVKNGEYDTQIDADDFADDDTDDPKHSPSA